MRANFNTLAQLASRLGVNKRLGVNTAKIADPNRQKRCSIKNSITLSNKTV